MAAPASRRSNGTTVMLLVAVVIGMGGLSFASVPLYRLFCEVTGFGGTTQRATAAPTEIADAVVAVRFNAQTASDLGWEFRPLVREIKVRPGEQFEMFYRATNRGAAPSTGTATYNVTPTKTGIYFEKIQCFCFDEQLLAPGESRDMGVMFFVSPDLVKDPSMRDVHTITLSYTMFRKPDVAASSARSSSSDAAAGLRGALGPATAPAVN
jgi:cytochrome c oxidase assembly protein subunit 11